MVSTRHRNVRLIVGLLGLVLAGMTMASPALAHEGPAAIAVTGENLVTPQQVEFTVDIIYALDEDPAAPSSFTVSGTGPDGETVGPVDLQTTETEGTYLAVVDFPVTGRWSMTFTSELPPGELTHEVTVGAVTTEPPDSASTDTAPTDTASPNGSGPAPTDATEEEATLVDSEGSDPPVGLIIGLTVAGVLVAGGAFLVLRSRARS